jgi:chromosomal replication initiation ATPase DnaA
MTPATSPDREDMAAITARVAKRYGVTVDDLRNGFASRKLAEPRQEAIALCYPGRSNLQVARYFGLATPGGCIVARKAFARRQAAAVPS